MSGEDKSGGAAPEEPVSDQHQGDPNQDAGGVESKDTVKYESYKKAVSEAKKHKSLVDELKSENEKLKQQQLEAEGKKDELIQQLKTEKEQLNQKSTKMASAFTRARAHDVIVDEAVKMGCTSTKLIKKLADDEVNNFEFDDDFNPDRNQVKSWLENLKQEEPTLFKKEAPSVKDGVPASFDKAPPKDISSMSTEDLKKNLGKLDSLF